MLKPIKHGCLLLLAAPAAAMAEPVTVVTHSTGTAYVFPTVLYALGQDELPAEDELPYELTLTSTFDWNGPLPARDASAAGYDTGVVVDFRMGELHYHYAGTEWSSASLYTPSYLGGDMYAHAISFAPYPDSYGYSFDFDHMFHAPAGSMGPGGALTPGVFGGDADPNGYMGITAFYSNDEYTFMWTMRGDVDTYSVRITSAVPEPPAYGLLAAGVLALALRRRGRRSDI